MSLPAFLRRTCSTAATGIGAAIKPPANWMGGIAGSSLMTNARQMMTESVTCGGQNDQGKSKKSIHNSNNMDYSASVFGRISSTDFDLGILWNYLANSVLYILGDLAKFPSFMGILYLILFLRITQQLLKSQNVHTYY
jgi:hypothetical protein